MYKGAFVKDSEVVSKMNEIAENGGRVITAYPTHLSQVTQSTTITIIYEEPESSTTENGEITKYYYLNLATKNAPNSRIEFSHTYEAGSKDAPVGLPYDALNLALEKGIIEECDKNIITGYGELETIEYEGIGTIRNKAKIYCADYIDVIVGNEDIDCPDCGKKHTVTKHKRDFRVFTEVGTTNCSVEYYHCPNRDTCFIPETGRFWTGLDKFCPTFFEIEDQLVEFVKKKTEQ